jgi:hypothetical protein
LAERLRDLTFCRQRLRHVQQALENVFNSPDDGDATSLPDLAAPAGRPEWAVAPSRGSALDITTTAGPTPLLSAEGYWDTLRGSSTLRVVLPPQARDLADAAQQFLDTLSPEQWTQLDQACQDQVLSQRGGLQKACLGTADLVRHLGALMIWQVGVCLSEHLPVTDVAQVELSLGQDLSERLRRYYQQAAPLLSPTVPLRQGAGSGARSAVAAGSGRAAPDSVADTPARQAARKDHTFLLIPASEAGKQFGELARKALPGVHLVSVPGQADLTFCREQGNLHLDDLQKILSACRAAYAELAVLPQTSAHARFDVQDWIPLDP